jgi:hypothetical protein
MKNNFSRTFNSTVEFLYFYFRSLVDCSKRWHVLYAYLLSTHRFIRIERNILPSKKPQNNLQRCIRLLRSSEANFMWRNNDWWNRKSFRLTYLIDRHVHSKIDYNYKWYCIIIWRNQIYNISFCLSWLRFLSTQRLYVVSLLSWLKMKKKALYYHRSDTEWQEEEKYEIINVCLWKIDHVSD